MNIESLKYFLYTEKHTSFSLASEELCISQSSLSKHIKKLEVEFNCVLFERSTRTIKFIIFSLKNVIKLHLILI